MSQMEIVHKGGVSTRTLCSNTPQCVALPPPLLPPCRCCRRRPTQRWGGCCWCRWSLLGRGRSTVGTLPRWRALASCCWSRSSTCMAEPAAGQRRCRHGGKVSNWGGVWPTRLPGRMYRSACNSFALHSDDGTNPCHPAAQRTVAVPPRNLRRRLALAVGSQQCSGAAGIHKGAQQSRGALAGGNVHGTLPVAVDAAHQLCGLLAGCSQQLQHDSGPVGRGGGGRASEPRWQAVTTEHRATRPPQA